MYETRDCTLQLFISFSCLIVVIVFIDEMGSKLNRYSFILNAVKFKCSHLDGINRLHASRCVAVTIRNETIVAWRLYDGRIHARAHFVSHTDRNTSLGSPLKQSLK